MFVTKFDGSKQPFDKSKIIRTCLKLRASIEQANIIANKIEKRAYDGISTKEILRMIFSYLKEFRPSLKYQIDLRDSIALLRPKPDFEHFVADILEEFGYKVMKNQIIQGKCVEHEVDVIAKKNDEIVYVEVKHHVQPHTYTGLDVFLRAKAAFEDLKKGYELRKHNYNFNKAMVVCNTKISDHAKKYANCENIEYIGWKYPEGRSIEEIIEKNKLYPITFLKQLKQKEVISFLDSGIITLKDLIKTNFHDLKRMTRISSNRLSEILRLARNILES